MQNERKSKDFRLWNERMSEKYDPDAYHTRSFFLIRWVEKMRVKAIFGFLGKDSRERILELGCGAGNLMQYPHPGHIVGIDISFRLLEKAKRKTCAFRRDFIQSFAENTPFKDKLFGKIYCSEVLEHVEEPEAVCAEANRVLKDEGMLVVSVPNETFINFIKKVMRLLFIYRIVKLPGGYKFSDDMTDEWHLHSFSKERLYAVSGALFRIVKMRYIPMPIFPVHIVALCEKKRAR